MSSHFARLGLDRARAALLCVLLVVAMLAIYRYYHYVTTGFFLPDEYTYVHDAWTGQQYGFRWLFGYLNIGIFDLLGIKTANGFAVFLPFYIVFWAAVTLISFYGIMKSLGFDSSVISWSLFLSLFLKSFSLVSLGFITEPMGLALATLGIYFLVRWLTSSGGLAGDSTFAFLAAASFVAAMYTREPYKSTSSR